jgi:hypothetical protein
MTKDLKSWEEEFDEWQEAWEGQRFEKGSLKEANLKDFISELLQSQKQAVEEEQISRIEEMLRQEMITFSRTPISQRMNGYTMLQFIRDKILTIAEVKE